MEFEGKVWKSRSSKFWVVYIETLDFTTQGTSKTDALAMLKDAIESMVNKKGFSVSVTSGKNDRFTVGARPSLAWMGFFLQQLRMKEGLTIEEVARRMGSNSNTAYARYEQGKVAPSLEKFEQILNAISPSKRPIFRLAA